MTKTWALTDIYQHVSMEDSALLFVNRPRPYLCHPLLEDMKLWVSAKKVGRIPTHPYTNEFSEAVLRESNWSPEEPTWINHDDRLPVVTGVIPCPCCAGARVYDRNYHGQDTGIDATFPETCHCTYLHSWWSVWSDPKMIPPRFRNVSLARLQPSRLSKMTEEDQEIVIDLLQLHPDYCYFIYGPSGTGKTHYSMALFGDAIMAWAWKLFLLKPGYTPERTVFRVSTKTWLDETMAYKRRSFDDDFTPLPALNEAVIRNLGKIPGVHVLVVFDEIDKFTATDPRLLDLFEIVNACSECGFQLIATSNHSPNQLALRWNSKHTDPILRRFYDNEGGQPRQLLECREALHRAPEPAPEGISTTDPGLDQPLDTGPSGDPTPPDEPADLQGGFRTRKGLNTD